MIARPKISRNEWQTTEIGAFEVGIVAPFSCPARRDERQEDGHREDEEGPRRVGLAEPGGVAGEEGEEEADEAQGRDAGDDEEVDLRAALVAERERPEDGAALDPDDGVVGRAKEAEMGEIDVLLA